jgi:hypothetical protein
MKRCVTGLILSIMVMGCGSVASSQASPTAVPTKSLATDDPHRMEAAVMQLRPQLAFAPYVPGYVPPGLVGQPTVVPQGGARGAKAALLEVAWRPGAAMTPTVLLLLQGPMGCCLDDVRANVTPNVQIRPGLDGHFIREIEPAHGGPILWWIDAGVYVALSSPSLGADELLRVARSMIRLR